MSTTVKLEVAVQYSTAQTSLLFKLRTDSFMQRGASVQFLSAFPAEEEGDTLQRTATYHMHFVTVPWRSGWCAFVSVTVLYPPLTFLKPTGKTMSIPFKGRMFNVIEVTPQFGG